MKFSPSVELRHWNTLVILRFDKFEAVEDQQWRMRAIIGDFHPIGTLQLASTTVQSNMIFWCHKQPHFSCIFYDNNYLIRCLILRNCCFFFFSCFVIRLG